MAITKAQEKEYVETGGVCCLVCHSHNIEGGGVDIQAHGAYQNIRCVNCNEEWTDEYILSSITETEV